MDFESLREDYDGRQLRRADLKADPFEQFDAWFQQALDAGVELPDAMSLATRSKERGTSVRTVVLRGHGRNGFRFFTHLNSLKARELMEHPDASIVFHWKPFHRQVRVSGEVEQVPREEVEEYFATRPRKSQLAAHVSEQQDVVEGRDELESSFDACKSRFEGQEVPCPEAWGGFRLKPRRFFFWQGRSGRLHDRFRYEREGDGDAWSLDRMSP